MGNKKKSLHHIGIAILLCIFALTQSPLLAKKKATRIISTSPILTEIIMAIGLEHELVGITTLCDYPPRVKNKIQIGAYKPNPKIIETLNPTHICQLGNDIILEESTVKNKIPIIKWAEPKTVTDIIHLIESVGKKFGKEKESKNTIDTLTHKIKEIRAITQKRKKKRIAFIFWHNPMMVIGSEGYLGEAVKLTGIKNVFKETKEPFIKTSIKEILKKSPTHILCARKSTYDIIRSNLKLDQYLRRNNIKINYLPDSPNLIRPGPQLPKLMEQIINEHP